MYNLSKKKGQRVSQRDKLIKKLENNPKNVSFETIKTVLEGHGWYLDRVSGSHHTFAKDDETITIPYRKPIKEFYVKLALKAIKGE